MKKLKIFLLLSILLCLGLFISNVSASSGGGEIKTYTTGPKVFEVGQVLPATTQLRISWHRPVELHRSTITMKPIIITEVQNLIYYTYWEMDGIPMEDRCNINDKDVYYSGTYKSPYTDENGNHNYIDIDTSSWSIAKRTITQVNDLNPAVFYWEDLNAPPGPKIFEEGDELPAGYIKISWDFTGYPMAVDGDFLISSDGDFSIRIWEFGNITLFINDEMFYADTPGNTIITLAESVTITDMDGYDDYYEYIHGALLWEVVSEDYINGFMEAREIYGFNMGGYWISGEQAWNNGYDLGSELAWEEGFEYGMDIYGYYDPITDQWLSVSGYLELYGTDKPGASDFYGNFDKYFIPAMIIVFGGAIVLTILKVFKGRE